MKSLWPGVTPLALPHIPLDPDEERFPLVRAAQQLRRMNVQPVLVEPDSPAQSLRHSAYYVPAGFFRPGAPALVVLRVELEGDGSAETVAMLRGALYHAAARTGIRREDVVACDEATSDCAQQDLELLRREVDGWWSWWAPRNGRDAAPARRVRHERAVRAPSAARAPSCE
jgi:hypothetical protein